MKIIYMCELLQTNDPLIFSIGGRLLSITLKISVQMEDKDLHNHHSYRFRLIMVNSNRNIWNWPRLEQMTL